MKLTPHPWLSVLHLWYRCTVQTKVPTETKVFTITFSNMQGSPVWLAFEVNVEGEGNTRTSRSPAKRSLYSQQADKKLTAESKKSMILKCWTELGSCLATSGPKVLPCFGYQRPCVVFLTLLSCSWRVWSEHDNYIRHSTCPSKTSFVIATSVARSSAWPKSVPLLVCR